MHNNKYNNQNNKIKIIINRLINKIMKYSK